MSVIEIPFKADWPIPDPRYLREELPQPPRLPLREVFSPAWARWIEEAAEAKAAPPDYVVAAILAAAGSLVGNSRWSTPWQGWAEPPILWAVAIGNPSMNKSPGLDAVLIPIRKIEKGLRKEADAKVAEWKARAEIAKLADSAWKEATKAAMKAGDDEPPRPDACDAGPAPNIPRLAVSDSTVEKLAVIVASQPRGTLLYRDELAGWLQGMTRYSGGGSDRPFWLEAYGGRGYSVERMGRDPVYIERLSVGVVGGIQPDRLKSLLMKTDDDGLLARFLPIWPNAAPIKRPSVIFDDIFMENAVSRLMGLEMVSDENGDKRPWFVPFSSDARDLLDEFRKTAREWEQTSEGLLLSFIGKLPGICVRLSLLLALLDFASGERDEPREIGLEHFGRAAHLAEAYFLPMARRAYSDGAASPAERTARRMVGLIREKGWSQFTSRDVLRAERSGLATSEEVDPASKLLIDADVIRLVDQRSGAKGGRPQKLFTVNPAIHGRRV
ncbi:MULTISPECIES: DUF3987 domain-containing protein [unclassified Rhizobium]|uniref:DUF3987 domain-containing protein n=1 Tax=unclassified Rhizobium TaxID=2613769 RepID=UPI0006FA2B7B|nr:MULTISPECIES: DUF3987 domain-containing protein [unclassified Rhizobium]KQV39175.1 hypothetical protein ASC86_23190 [Rhizobium sp. Root1212]KRD35149.1 hypothetical protein ASE37_21760 [Rhizobium sp. Root268]